MTGTHIEACGGMRGLKKKKKNDLETLEERDKEGKKAGADRRRSVKSCQIVFLFAVVVCDS